MAYGYHVLEPIYGWEQTKTAWGDHSSLIEQWFEAGDNLVDLEPFETKLESHNQSKRSFQAVLAPMMR